ncbi:MAG TPA: hypothetical protein VK075_07545 [Pseudogracilibacillus sp.]|nr:hypothetical protein [Pseudogracilibacillus sp.]
MSKWFYINSFFIILVIISILQGPMYDAKWIGFIAFLFFMFNWMRHAMFATLRSKMARKKKIKLAKLSKKAMPWHRWTGTAAALFAVIHGLMMIHTFGFQTNNFKMMFGLMALVIIVLTVLTGWWRLMRTTVRKRLIHLTLAFTLFYLLVFHILL